MFKLFLISFLLIKEVALIDNSYYEILGIPKEASSQNISQAYKKLAIKFHPDKNPNAEEQEAFIKITEAYTTLKDPEKRRNYDSYGSYTQKYDWNTEAGNHNLYNDGLYHDDPFVDTLSPNNYHDYLQDGFYFINFYSPFCPPCQHLAKDWKRLAEVYKGIVRIGAVNCKNHKWFCYDTFGMRCLPSLLFFPNGKHGKHIDYSGDVTYEALDRFVMTHIASHVYMPTVTGIKDTDKPMAYVLGKNRIEKDALTRIGYHLNGLVDLAIIEDDVLCQCLYANLTENEHATVVFTCETFTKEIYSSEEKEVLMEISAALPVVEMIGPEKLNEILITLRSEESTPWVLYLSSPGQGRLLLHQIKMTNTSLNFGEIDCEEWVELCLSLQVELEQMPAWAVLKPRGVFQLVPPAVDIRSYIHIAAAATTLRSLSASDLQTILDGELEIWVLLDVSNKLLCGKFLEPFTKASMYYNTSEVSFGTISCSRSSDKQCRELASDQATIVVVTGTKGQYYRYTGGPSHQEILEFVDLLREATDIELTENQAHNIMDSSSRDQSWLVAFLPANCEHFCDALIHQWKIVAKKLRPLSNVRMGVIRCDDGRPDFCENIRSPTARLYLYSVLIPYSVNLQYLSEAPKILEWALDHLDESILNLDWHTFNKEVVAEELNPGPGVKPWLVYYHSPLCPACLEMYSDVAVAGILLKNAVHLGKVNCVSESNLCEHVTCYPALKLHINRNQYHKASTVVNLEVVNYACLLRDIKAHLQKYDESLLAETDDAGVRRTDDAEVGSQQARINHDEF